MCLPSQGHTQGGCRSCSLPALLLLAFGVLQSLPPAATISITRDHSPASLLKGTSCPLVALPPDPLMVYTFKGRPLAPQALSSFVLEEGEEMSARCTQPGLYLQEGGSLLSCIQGTWHSNTSCTATNHAVNYTTGTAVPAIVWHVAPGGVVEVAGGGQLVLLPGAILQLDCLYPRLRGNPTWTWTPEYRKYPTGWSISSSERELHYRLSVYYAKTHDTGDFTCTSPHGATNSISLIVKDVSCPELDMVNSVSENDVYHDIYGGDLVGPSSGDSADHADGTGGPVGGQLIVSGSGRQLGAERHFSCFKGYYLLGEQTMKCLPSGVWSSSSPPSCAVVKCPPLPPLPPLLRLRHLTQTAGGTALFSCPPSYTLAGSSSLVCLNNATWSAPPPHCQEVLCPAPASPPHGSASVPALRRVGDVAVYSCDDSYVLQGARLLACTSAGTWSRPVPNCVISCTSPGKPLKGRVSPRLSRYRLGAVLLVSCSPGYRPAGPDRLKCLQTGRWSSPLPPCVPSLSG